MKWLCSGHESIPFSWFLQGYWVEYLTQISSGQFLSLILTHSYEHVLLEKWSNGKSSWCESILEIVSE